MNQRKTITRGRSSRLFSSHLPPLERLCQREGNTYSSGNQHFMRTAQFPAIKPSDQPSHFWAAQHFSLWPRAKASLYPENSYEEDYINFPWLFFFQDLKPKQYLNILLPMVSMSEWVVLRFFHRMGYRFNGGMRSSRESLVLGEPVM